MKSIDPSTGRIAISGASGLIGRALTRALREAGWQVSSLVRPGSSSADGIPWDPEAGVLEAEALRGFSAVVHLAGEGITGRWTAEKKKRILNSRVRGTRLVAETLAALDPPPPVLICASAIGFYGDRGDEVMSEGRTKGEGFLADVTWRWEAAAAAARKAGVRVVHLRIGVVLSRDGGALEQMLPPFKMGVGGRLGDGRQWFSWIHLEDMVAAILFALRRSDLEGPVNAVAPNPVRNLELTRTLGRILRRPAFLPAPTFALNAAFGEMARATLLASTRVHSLALTEAGFEFRWPELEPALRHELGRAG